MSGSLDRRANAAFVPSPPGTPHALPSRGNKAEAPTGSPSPRQRPRSPRGIDYPAWVGQTASRGVGWRTGVTLQLELIAEAETPRLALELETAFNRYRAGGDGWELDVAGVGGHQHGSGVALSVADCNDSATAGP
jgi:hypothetical protein